ncbi:MAG: hypothetical protein ACJ8E3_04015 [Sphingomicrobium sp.]
MKPRDWPSPFLDDWLGRPLADGLRSLIAPHPHHDSPYGIICSCGGGSYLEASFSSLWAFLVLLIAFTAGLTFPFKKKIAWWMLAIGAAVSLLDTGIRVIHRLERVGAYREIMMDRLPSQILANLLFQFAVPFFAGLAVALIAEGLRRAIEAGWAGFSRAP